MSILVQTGRLLRELVEEVKQHAKQQTKQQMLFCAIARVSVPGGPECRYRPGAAPVPFGCLYPLLAAQQRPP